MSKVSACQCFLLSVAGRLHFVQISFLDIDFCRELLLQFIS
jgi:hypothetical protein